MADVILARSSASAEPLSLKHRADHTRGSAWYTFKASCDISLPPNLALVRLRAHRKSVVSSTGSAGTVNAAVLADFLGIFGVVS